MASQVAAGMPLVRQPQQQGRQQQGRQHLMQSPQQQQQGRCLKQRSSQQQGRWHLLEATPVISPRDLKRRSQLQRQPLAVIPLVMDCGMHHLLGRFNIPGGGEPSPSYRMLPASCLALWRHGVGLYFGQCRLEECSGFRSKRTAEYGQGMSRRTAECGRNRCRNVLSGLQAWCRRPQKQRPQKCPSPAAV